jgi:hypothetical protein
MAINMLFELQKYRLPINVDNNSNMAGVIINNIIKEENIAKQWAPLDNTIFAKILRYKIRMMGIPLSGPTYVYGDNKSQVTNSSRPELPLKKKCNSICYHAIRESVAMGETLLMHIRTEENLADFLTKTTSGTKRRKLVSGVIHDIYDDFQQ